MKYLTFRQKALVERTGIEPAVPDVKSGTLNHLPPLITKAQEVYDKQKSCANAAILLTSETETNNHSRLQLKYIKS